MRTASFGRNSSGRMPIWPKPIWLKMAEWTEIVAREWRSTPRFSAKGVFQPNALFGQIHFYLMDFDQSRKYSKLIGAEGHYFKKLSLLRK
jgi:hypothetical protein